MQNNMMRRHRMGIVFEAIKLLLLLVSGLLTYQFLGRFMPSMWERIAALAMYELGLLAWHYIHHWKVETPRQHMFSKNMERLCLLAVGSAAGFQLLSMISAGFGDHLPGWTHTVVEFGTVAIFMIQIWAFTRWEKLSRYYQAVEHSYNRELASGQTSIIETTLAATGMVDAPANRPAINQPSDPNLALPESTSEAEAETSGDTDLAAPNVVQKVINAATAKVAPVRVEDRLLVLELLQKEHPDMSAKEISANTGLSPRSVRRWQKEGR